MQAALLIGQARRDYIARQQARTDQIRGSADGFSSHAKMHSRSRANAELDRAAEQDGDASGRGELAQPLGAVQATGLNGRDVEGIHGPVVQESEGKRVVKVGDVFDEGRGHGCAHSRQGRGCGVWVGIDLFGMVLGHFACDALDRRLNRIHAQRG